MANLTGAQLNIAYSWEHEGFDVTGHVDFLFGATKYRLTLDQQVAVPCTYTNVADQIEHVFIDVAGQLGKLGNANLSLQAVEVATYL